MSLDENPRGRQAIIISSAFNALALIVALLRIYTRIFIVRHFGVEDGFAVCALTCSVGLTVTIAIQAKYGMGEHGSQIDLPTLQNSLKTFYASLLIYNLSLGLVKLSLLVQYKRIFPTKRFQIACWIVMTMVAAHTTWAVLGSVFACLPINAFWLKEGEGKDDDEVRCLDQIVMWFTNAAINIFTDIVIIVFPMPVIRSLNLEKRQKQALTAIFAIGGLVCLTSALRLYSLVAISNSPDPTYDNPPAATWSAVETNIGIVCSCLPCLRPLLARCFPGTFSMAASKDNDESSVQSFCSRGVLRGRFEGERKMGIGKEISVEEDRIGGMIGR